MITTALLSTGFTAAYLASIYCLPPILLLLRSPPRNANAGVNLSDRNHPHVIQLRLISISITTALSFLALPPILRYCYTLPHSMQLQHLLGLSSPPSVLSTLHLLLYPALLTASLFTGSFCVYFMQATLPGMRNSRAEQEFMQWSAVRNYLVVSRSAVLHLHLVPCSPIDIEIDPSSFWVPSLLKE